jgi:hypothetical protein
LHRAPVRANAQKIFTLERREMPGRRTIQKEREITKPRVIPKGRESRNRA